MLSVAFFIVMLSVIWLSVVMLIVSWLFLSDGFHSARSNSLLSVAQCAHFTKAAFQMGHYHPLDGVTNLKSKLLYLVHLTKKFKEKGTSF